MQEKFRGFESATDYFTITAERVIDKCYRYFSNNPQKRTDGRDVYKPDDTSSLSEKLLFVLTSLDIKLKSNIFQRMNQRIEEEEIPASVSSPLPSIQLSG